MNAFSECCLAWFTCRCVGNMCRPYVALFQIQFVTVWILTMTHFLPAYNVHVLLLMLLVLLLISLWLLPQQQKEQEQQKIAVGTFSIFLHEISCVPGANLINAWRSFFKIKIFTLNYCMRNHLAFIYANIFIYLLLLLLLLLLLSLLLLLLLLFLLLIVHFYKFWWHFFRHFLRKGLSWLIDVYVIQTLMTKV